MLRPLLQQVPSVFVLLPLRCKATTYVPSRGRTLPIDRNVTAILPSRAVALDVRVPMHVRFMHVGIHHGRGHDKNSAMVGVRSRSEPDEHDEVRPSIAFEQRSPARRRAPLHGLAARASRLHRDTDLVPTLHSQQVDSRCVSKTASVHVASDPPAHQQPRLGD